MDTMAKTLEVDPIQGNDRSGGSQPRFKTLTAALGQSQSGTLIRLNPGQYTLQTGEIFPLQIPSGVTLMGNEAGNGDGILIQGGGWFTPTTGSRVSVTLVVQGSAQVRGITVINPQGNGLIILQGNPLIRSSRFRNCGQDGLWIMGTARPTLENCEFDPVGGNGILVGEQARGDIRNCTVRHSQCGLKLGDQAAPLLDHNQCISNQVGIWVLGQASPVLRHNQVLQNQTAGLWVQDQANPDIGHPHDPGYNRFRYQQQADIRNDRSQPLVSVGNDVVPQYLKGEIKLQAIAIPDPAAIACRSVGQTITSLQPTASAQTDGATGAPSSPHPAPTSSTQGSATPVASQFTDVSGHWAAAYIEALANRGLIKGFADGSFRPDAAVTRGQFAALVAASYPSRPMIREAVAFKDVSASYWGQSAILTIYRQGFMGGYPDQTFRPEQAITRIQGIVAIASGLELTPAPASVLSIYRDRAQIPSYAVNALAAATQQHLVVNYPEADHLRPLEPMTRAEVAALVYQGLVSLGQAPTLESAAVVSPDRSQTSFPDIADHWAEPFILGLVQQGLIRGFDDGRFQPDQSMTRAQFASLVVRAFQPAPKRASLTFTDVSPNFWAASAIDSAYRAGFLSGFPDGSFAPDHALLRVQIWVSLVNGLELATGQSPPTDLLQRYTDRASIPSYALAGVAIATQNQLVVNVPELNQLNPNRVASRADVSATVYQALVALKRLPAVHSPDIVIP